MTKEAYVTFEVAKLLKEKGFDTPSYITGHVYSEHGTLQSNTSFRSVTMDYITACTQQMAMRWLREVHNTIVIIIPSVLQSDNLKWITSIRTFNKEEYYLEDQGIVGKYNTYEDACENAIKYCLENII